MGVRVAVSVRLRLSVGKGYRALALSKKADRIVRETNSSSILSRVSSPAWVEKRAKKRVSLR